MIYRSKYTIFKNKEGFWARRKGRIMMHHGHTMRRAIERARYVHYNQVKLDKKYKEKP